MTPRLSGWLAAATRAGGVALLVIFIGVGCAFFLSASPDSRFFVGCFAGTVSFPSPPDGEVTLIIREQPEGSLIEGCMRFVHQETLIATLVGDVDPDNTQRAQLDGEAADGPIRLRLVRQPDGATPAEFLGATDASGRFENARLGRCDPELAFEDLCAAVLFSVVPQG